MKKYLISLLFLFLVVSTSFVGVSTPNTQEKSLSLDDTPGIQWSRQYGAKEQDRFEQVRKTTDNGYLMVGYTKSYSSDGYMAAWLVKTNAMGYEEWNHTYSSFAVVGTDCQQTTDGGYAFCGANNQSRFWLVKTDAYGVELWEKSYDSGTAWCFTQTMDEGYVLSGNPEMFIRTDSQGTVLWKNTYLDPSSTVVEKILQTMDGGFIAVGKTYYYSHSHPNGFLLKIDENGTEEWNNTFFKSESGVFFSFLQTPDNGYLATGSMNQNPWVVRTDQNGNELWNKTYTDIKGLVYDVVSLYEGGYAMVGTDGEYSFFLTIDENGTKQWNIPFNTNIICLLSLQQAPDGGIITAGVDESIDTLGNGILMKIGHVPHASITRPTNAFYLFDQERRSLRFPFIIGPITIEADAYDTEYAIDRVEFLVDGALKNTDFTAPYSWRWSAPSIFPHILLITAYNIVGNCSKVQIKIYKLL